MNQRITVRGGLLVIIVTYTLLLALLNKSNFQVIGGSERYVHFNIRCPYGKAKV